MFIPFSAFLLLYSSDSLSKHYTRPSCFQRPLTSLSGRTFWQIVDKILTQLLCSVFKLIAMARQTLAHSKHTLPHIRTSTQLQRYEEGGHIHSHIERMLFSWHSLQRNLLNAVYMFVRVFVGKLTHTHTPPCIHMFSRTHSNPTQTYTQAAQTKSVAYLCGWRIYLRL